MAFSAGLLMFRRREVELEYFLVHPGGPYFARKDDGWWGIPKGLVERDEEALAAACREFTEEVGAISSGPYLPLGEVTLRSGKRVAAWGFEVAASTEIDLVSNEVLIEWPPRSGTRQSFPEVDRGGFFPWEEAHRKITPAQAPFLKRLFDAAA